MKEAERGLALICGQAGPRVSVSTSGHAVLNVEVLRTRKLGPRVIEFQAQANLRVTILGSRLPGEKLPEVCRHLRAVVSRMQDCHSGWAWRVVQRSCLPSNYQHTGALSCGKRPLRAVPGPAEAGFRQVRRGARRGLKPTQAIIPWTLDPETLNPKPSTPRPQIRKPQGPKLPDVHGISASGFVDPWV